MSSCIQVFSAFGGFVLSFYFDRMRLVVPRVLRLNFSSSGPTRKFGPGPTKLSAASKEKYPGAPCWSCEKVFDEK